jgi:hypothetical protein
MISNGEYMPALQIEKQKRVEARIEELADVAGKRLGISRGSSWLVRAAWRPHSLP